MDPKYIANLQPLLKHENFNVEKMKSASAVAASLCAWVLAMDKYYSISLVVGPKKLALGVAEKEYAELNEQLNAKKENLRIV